MRLRKITTLLLLLCTSSLALGQNNRDMLSSKTVLYKITATNSTKTSYLFGTHHAFGKLFFDSLTAANQALSGSEIVIKENLNIPGHTAEDIINNRKKVVKWRTYLNRNDLTFIKNLFAKSPTDYSNVRLWPNQPVTKVRLYPYTNKLKIKKPSPPTATVAQAVHSEKKATTTSL